MNQLDVTYYFIVLLIGSTCFGNCHAHHRELATKMLITISVVSFSKDGRGSELPMMGVVVPETCSAYKKYNKIVSGI